MAASFRTDTSFLEKIAIGATGTIKVFEHLQDQGHAPIELERGSMSFKVWKSIKIKRIRVPDILCVSCGKRIESRAKTKFEISMSHSTSDPERGWDTGLEDTDYVSFVACSKHGEGPIDWVADDLIQYINVRDMRNAIGRGEVKLVEPKGAQEGFEQRIIWPCSVASAPGVITEIIPQSKLKFRRATDDYPITLKLQKDLTNLVPVVGVGDRIRKNQILASVVPVILSFQCQHGAGEDYYLEMLGSTSLSHRYAAAKALSAFRTQNVVELLLNKMGDQNEHIYVKLDAAASLARQGERCGWQFLSRCLKDEYLQNRMESVITLGEIQSPYSTRLLSRVLLDNGQNSEIRAGAAWSLGELRGSEAVDALISSFNAMDNSIKVEAARSLSKLAHQFSPEIINKLSQSSNIERPGIAWALGRAGQFQIKDLMDSLVDEDTRHWVSYIIGSRNREQYINQINNLIETDSEVYFAVTVLWKIMSSWVFNLEDY